jgi:hypothetical protein
LTNATVLSKYPFAYTALGELDDLETAGDEFSGYNIGLYADYSFRFNLDKGNLGGNVIEFTSTQGVKHHLIWYLVPVIYTTGSYATSFTSYGGGCRYTTRYVLIEGDNWTSPVATITGSLTGSVSGLVTSSGFISAVTVPVAVDTVNKFIYCNQVCVQAAQVPGIGYNSEVNFTRVLNMCKIPFSTRLDGSLAISSATGSVIGNGLTKYTHHSIDASPVYYCGRNNDGTPMFINQIECDTSGYLNASGNFQSATNTSYLGQIKTLWNASKTNSAPKIYFDKLVGGTVTNVASINLSSNQFSSTGASKPMCAFAPSKFESSTASGETNISYSYSLCFNDSSVPSIIYYRWDKATPSGSANLCSIDWGAVTSTDKIAFPFPSALTLGNSSNDYMPQRTIAHCFVTTLGSARYLNVLYTYGDAKNLQLKTLAGQVTLTTFQIDTSTWQSLTYVGSVAGVSAYSYCSLNDANSRIAVIAQGGMKVYSCTAGVWSLVSSETGAINIVARDYQNRVWAVDLGNYSPAANPAGTPLANGSNAYAVASLKILLHSSNLPNLASVEFVNRDQTFTGTNLTNQLRVNAYDTSSNRVETTVNLKILGANAYFTSNSSTSINVTTSTTGHTLVGITITGSGLVNVTASFTL